MKKLLFFLIFSAFFIPSVAFADAEVSNDGWTTDFTNSSPNTVCINDTDCFYIYMQNARNPRVASSTDSGATWSDNILILDSIHGDSPGDNKSQKTAVWYDQWTPGDTTGTKIHVVTFDNLNDDSYYTEFDVITNVISTTVITGVEAASLSASGNYLSITKAENGTLYLTVMDGSDSWVHTCAATCTTGGNWSAITSPYSNGNDPIFLLPVKGSNNIMLVQWDYNINDMQSRIYSATSTSWWSFNVIDADVGEDASFGGSMMGGTLDRSSGTIHLVFVKDNRDNHTVEDHDVQYWSWSNSTFAWTQGTDVITDAAGGIDGSKIAVDEGTGDLYVCYLNRSDITDGTTMDVFCKSSTDDGSTWGTASAALNTEIQDQIYSFEMSMMSDERIAVGWKYSNTGAAYHNDYMYADVADVTPPVAGTSVAVVESVIWFFAE